MLGRPHPRWHPEDTAQHFNYALGFTVQKINAEILHDGPPHREVGRQIGTLGKLTRAAFQARIRDLLITDAGIRRFFDGDSRVLPTFDRDKPYNSLGPLWEALPSGALMHDQNAYLKSSIIAAAQKRPADVTASQSRSASATRRAIG